MPAKAALPDVDWAADQTFDNIPDEEKGCTWCRAFENEPEFNGRFDVAKVIAHRFGSQGISFETVAGANGTQKFIEIAFANKGPPSAGIMFAMERVLLGVKAGTLAPVGEKRKREPFGPGQKIANKMLNSFVYTTSEQKHPACVKGIEAYKNVSEQHMKDVQDILLGTWNAIKHTKDGKSKYGAEEGSELPYNGKLAKVLSRKFGELRKEHEKKASAAAASAGSAASLLTVAEDDAENVPSNAQEVAPQE